MLALTTLTLALASLAAARPAPQAEGEPILPSLSTTSQRPVPTYPSTFPSTPFHPTDQIGNIMRNKCLDVRGGAFANGTPVQM